MTKEQIIKKALDHIYQNEDVYETLDILSSWGMSGQEMLEVWEEYIEPDAPFRVCDVCGNIMFDGYYAGDGTGKHYCSDKCLSTDYTMQEWEDMYTPEGNNYYTEWR